MMRTQHLVASILLGCVVSLHAQTAPQPQTPRPNPKSDWWMVESIEPGTSISIQTDGRWHHCVFDRAADEYVKCSPRSSTRPTPTGTLDYRRTKVTKVRVERTIDASAPLGALIGAGIGVGVGAIRGGNGDTTLSGELMIGAGLGALFGGVTGHVFPFRHSVVVYQQP